MSIVAIAKLVAVEGQARTALDLAKRSQAACLQLDACEKFEIFQGVDNPHHFTLVEQWSSKEAHKAFVDALMKDSETLDAMKLFSKGPEIEYFNLE